MKMYFSGLKNMWHMQAFFKARGVTAEEVTPSTMVSDSDIVVSFGHKDQDIVCALCKSQGLPLLSCRENNLYQESKEFPVVVIPLDFTLLASSLGIPPFGDLNKFFAILLWIGKSAVSQKEKLDNRAYYLFEIKHLLKRSDYEAV